MKTTVVSKVVSHYKPSKDLVYKFPFASTNESVFVITTPAFGVFYDHSFPSSESELLVNFPDLTTKIEQSVLFPLNEANDNAFDDLDDSSNQINKQVQLFINLIEDLLKQGITDYHSIIPTFSALLACVKSGWKPKNISKICSQIVVYIFLFTNLF